MGTWNVKHKNLVAASVAAAVVGVLGISAQQASAAFVPLTLYATSVQGSSHGLFAVNITAPTVFTVTPIDITSYYDSLVFDGAGNILLTGGGNGLVTKLSGFNPITNTYVTKTNFLVSSDGARAIQDIVMEPAAVSAAAALAGKIPLYDASHRYALVSDMGVGTIGRVDTTTGTVTWLGGGSGINYGTVNNAFGRPGPEGLAYVPNNANPTGFSLIATVGNRNNPAARTLAELDAITGAVTANQKSGLTGNDGLGYDSVNGLLYSSNRTGVALYADINPLNLAAYAVTPGTNYFAIPADGGANGVQNPDGVAPDGHGNVYIASYDTTNVPGNIYMYDEVTHAMILVANLPGLDDIAPILPNVGDTPEPASLGLLGLGALALLTRKNRR